MKVPEIRIQSCGASVANEGNFGGQLEAIRHAAPTKDDISIFSDDDELISSSSQESQKASPKFKRKIVTSDKNQSSKNVDSGYVFGLESKFRHLNLASTKMDRHGLDDFKTHDEKGGPMSPSLGHRESATLMPAWTDFDQNSAVDVVQSPNNKLDTDKMILDDSLNNDDSTKSNSLAKDTGGDGFNELGESALVLGVVYLRTAAMLAQLHRREKRFKPALQCVTEV